MTRPATTFDGSSLGVTVSVSGRTAISRDRTWKSPACRPLGRPLPPGVPGVRLTLRLLRLRPCLALHGLWLSTPQSSLCNRCAVTLPVPTCERVSAGPAGLLGPRVVGPSLSCRPDRPAVRQTRRGAGSSLQSELFVASMGLLQNIIVSRPQVRPPSPDPNQTHPQKSHLWDQ